MDGSHDHPRNCAREPERLPSRQRSSPDGLQCIHLGLMTRFRGCDREAARGSQLFGRCEMLVKEVGSNCSVLAAQFHMYVGGQH